jgi:hypothetical protein
MGGNERPGFLLSPPKTLISLWTLGSRRVGLGSKFKQQPPSPVPTSRQCCVSQVAVLAYHLVEQRTCDCEHFTNDSFGFSNRAWGLSFPLKLFLWENLALSGTLLQNPGQDWQREAEPHSHLCVLPKSLGNVEPASTPGFLSGLVSFSLPGLRRGPGHKKDDGPLYWCHFEVNQRS